LLGTVTAVTTNPDGSQVVTTEPAMLEEVFPEGDIEVSLAEASAPQALPQGVMTASYAMPEPSDGGLKVEDPFKPDQKGDDPPACSLSGVEVDFGPYVDMKFRVRWRLMEAPVVTALATLGAEARMALHNVAVECGWDTVIWKKTVTFMAGTVPIVVVFQLGAALDVNAGLDGLDLEASAKAWVTIGVKDNKGYVDAGYAFRLTGLDEAQLQARQLTAYAMADAWLDFSVILYKVVGPKISVGPFIETGLSSKVTNPPRPWWWLDFGLAGRVSLKLDLWFHEWNWKLWAGEIPLADLLVLADALEDCLPYPHRFAAGEPCRSPMPTARANGEPRSNMARRILGSFHGEAGDDYVVWNEGTFDGAVGSDWVSQNFGDFTGGPGNDHVDTNYPEGTFLGGDGVDTVDDNQGVFDPGPQ
jgi:hypothetical protein